MLIGIYFHPRKFENRNIFQTPTIHIHFDLDKENAIKDSISIKNNPNAPSSKLLIPILISLNAVLPIFPLILFVDYFHGKSKIHPKQ